jgi:hypothetical protein
MVTIGHIPFQLVYGLYPFMPMEYPLPMSNSNLDQKFSPTHILTSHMAKLKHLDETCQEIAKRTSTKQWYTMLWVQQNQKIKAFSMGDIGFWFPNGRKEHTKSFLKWWFGPYKIHNCLPNNIVLLVNIDKFEPNSILVNMNKFKPYQYLGQTPRGLKVTIKRGREHKEDS